MMQSEHKEMKERELKKKPDKQQHWSDFEINNKIMANII